MSSKKQKVDTDTKESIWLQYLESVDRLIAKLTYKYGGAGAYLVPLIMDETADANNYIFCSGVGLLKQILIEKGPTYLDQKNKNETYSDFINRLYLYRQKDRKSIFEIKEPFVQNDESSEDEEEDENEEDDD